MSPEQINTEGDDAKSFLALLLGLLGTPKETWAELAKPYLGPRNELTKYYLPALFLSLSGGLCGQSVFGIYYKNEVFLPIISALLIQTAAYGFAQLVMPFLLSKPLRWFAKRKGGRSDLDASRRLIMLSYFPLLACSAFQFIPLLGFLSVGISIYSLYIFYTGIGPILELPEESRMTVCLFGIFCFIAYMVMAILVVVTLPQPYPEFLEALEASVG